MSDEVLESEVLGGAGTAVGFDHHHLIGAVGVDISVQDIGNVCNHVRFKLQDVDPGISYQHQRLENRWHNHLRCYSRHLR